MDKEPLAKLRGESAPQPTVFHRWRKEFFENGAADFYCQHPPEGCRRPAFLMLDAGIAAVSPSSAWRVLSQAGPPRKWNPATPPRGTGLQQPPQPRQHLPIDVSCIVVSSTFYHLRGVLDGYSRAVMRGDLREATRAAAVEIILEAAQEKYPDAKPRIVSGNGPRFFAKDCQEFIRISGMTRGRTPPCDPRPHGKLERWRKSLKGARMRPGAPLTLEDARRLSECGGEHDNTVRPHGATGFVTPADMLAGRPSEIRAARDRKLERVRQQRQRRRRQAV